MGPGAAFTGAGRPDPAGLSTVVAVVVVVATVVVVVVVGAAVGLNLLMLLPKLNLLEPFLNNKTH